jgi:hypothetical protein
MVERDDKTEKMGKCHGILRYLDGRKDEYESGQNGRQNGYKN